MMVGKFTLLFAAALSFSASGDADKPFYLESFEHPSPTVRGFEIAGTFGPENRTFRLSLRFRQGQWDVRIERAGRAPLKLRLDEAYGPIPFNRLKLAMDGANEQLVVLIPFGPPHDQCFANGDEVYSRISIGSGDAIKLQHFPDCDFRESGLPVRKQGEWLLVGPPPGRR